MFVNMSHKHRFHVGINHMSFMNTEKKSCNEDVRNEIPEFTQDEVQAAIDRLKKR